MKYAKVAAVAAGTLMAVGAAAPAFADSGASGEAAFSQGVASGNLVQAPIHIPLSVCGSTVNVIGVINPAFGSTCINS
ncbi:chaplin [Streptomyces sp. NPDC052042]|uniref:chaplin n=1 Tax=Streptomyces sp. NPDC052042 TaxID=3365683 RepID=UPI0037D5BF70